MELQYVEFTDKEKAEMFDIIAARFYQRNFGQTSKSDLELLMFHFYMEKLLSNNKDDFGVISFNACSDYKISNELGITQQRVRNLKVKKQLVYPAEFDWIKALAALTEEARFERHNQMVSINIPDPNLFIEIQNFIEEQGGYIEAQINPKLLKMRLEYYIQLIIKVEGEDTEKKILKRIRPILLKGSKTEDRIEGLTTSKLFSKADNLLPVVLDLATINSPVGMLAGALAKAIK